MIDQLKEQRRNSVSSLAKPQTTGGEPKQQASNQKRRRSFFSILFNPLSSARGQVKLGDSPEGGPNKQAHEEAAPKRPKKRDKDEDADSYLLDLNDRLAIEKLYTQGNARLVEQPARQIEQLERRLPETTKPLGPPSMLAIRTPRLRSAPASNGRTCLLEPRFDSLGLSSDEDQTDSSSSSSALSLDFTMDSRAPVKQIDINMNEQEERLFKWRLLAARSAWAAGSPISSDSELELLDCQSPAQVIACSDDTSCSSVELIWSKSAHRSGSSSFGGSANASPNIGSPKAQVEPQAQPDEYLAPTSRASQGFFARRSFRHKLSIFELAKPMRAKNKSTPSPSQWVANPLFANGNDDDGHELLDETKSNCSSHRLSSSNNNNNHSYHNTDNDNNVNTSNTNNNDDDTDHCKGERINNLRWRRAKKRWSSIKFRSEQCSANKHNESNNCIDNDNDDDKRRSSPETGSLKQRDNIYLNHILNLDRKIKSNVSSLRSQLSETSKRASVLADQLLTSIKDTTKEQLFSHHSSGRRKSSLARESIFDGLADQEPTSNRRAEKPFSLIYMHQQPVVTRQPRSSGFAEGLVEPSDRAPSANAIINIGITDVNQHNLKDDKEPPVTVIETKEQSSQTPSISKSTGERSKRLKKRKQFRRRIIVEPPSSDDDEDVDPGFRGGRKFRPRVRRVSRSQSLELADLLR